MAHTLVRILAAQSIDHGDGTVTVLTWKLLPMAHMVELGVLMGLLKPEWVGRVSS